MQDVPQMSYRAIVVIAIVCAVEIFRKYGTEVFIED
jgi:hypothetical protein